MLSVTIEIEFRWWACDIRNYVDFC